jgi:hypothetical protein
VADFAVGAGGVAEAEAGEGDVEARAVELGACGGGVGLLVFPLFDEFGFEEFEVVDFG